jgi:hypothetical protein
MTTDNRIIHTIVGMRYIWAGKYPVQIRVGDQIALVAEPENTTDPDAVKCYIGEYHFGWVKASDSNWSRQIMLKHRLNRLSQWLLRGHLCAGKVISVHQGDKPWFQVEIWEEGTEVPSDEELDVLKQSQQMELFIR